MAPACPERGKTGCHGVIPVIPARNVRQRTDCAGHGEYPAFQGFDPARVREALFKHLESQP